MVPEAWRRVLTAWNEDIAVGITLLPADTGLSCGTFEHQALEHDHGATGATGHPVAIEAADTATEMAEHAVAAGAGAARGDDGAAQSTTEGCEGAASRGASGQTDLRGWLRP